VASGQLARQPRRIRRRPVCLRRQRGVGAGRVAGDRDDRQRAARVGPARCGRRGAHRAGGRDVARDGAAFRGHARARGGGNAPPSVWEMFARDLYHSPRVVWGREVNVLLAALAGRNRPAAVDSVRGAVERSGLQYAELWSYKMEGGTVRAVRYGSSSDVQLWT